MSAKEEKDEAGHAEGGEAKPKGKKKLIIIIAAVVLLLGGGGAFMMMGGEKKEGDEEHHEEPEKIYETVKLDTFIVNLSENTTFLKTTILIEYDPSLLISSGASGGSAKGGGHAGGSEPPKGGLPPAMEKRKPMITDAVIRVLSSKKSSDVLSPEGKEQLKQELIEAINEAIGLDDAPVVNIYFTEFIIQ